MTRTIVWAALAFAAGAAVAVGCQEADDHPAYIEIRCEAGQQCHDIPPPARGSGGTTSEAGGSDAFADAEVTDVNGSVALLTSEDFTNAIGFSDTATIEMQGAAGAPVTGNYDGTSFSIANALVTEQNWATVFPAPGDALPTLQPVDTTFPSPFALLVVPRSTLELVYALFTAPTAPAEGSAQIVLQFLDLNTQEPIEGVSVAHAAAEVVAYDAGASYNDSLLATGPRGFALLVNVPAVQLPAEQTLQITLGQSVGALDVVVRAGAVTLADVFLDP